MNNNTKIYIFDTTLRDGEQALASSLNRNEKVEIALAISALGVDIMEVGFPVSSPGDFDSVSAIAREVKGPVICGLSRVITKDVEQCGEALKHAERKRIHTFISTSPIHLKHKLGMTLTDATRMAVSAIHTARKYTDDVELGLEDATRTRLDDLCYVIERAIKAGATTIALADTVGYIVPEEFTHLITAIRNKVPNIDKARIAVHCHNDLGLAVANSYAAVAAGATQVECTVNGIGERAGNCSLEEIAMLLNTRKEIGNYYTDIVTENIKHASDTVSRICKMPVQANKAIVGSNAFSHSSGIHQDGVLKSENTYEIIAPEKVGVATHTMNLTARSGSHMIKHLIREMGFKPSDEEIVAVYQRFLELADERGNLQQYDLEAIIYEDYLGKNFKHFRINSITAATAGQSTVEINISVGDKIRVCPLPFSDYPKIMSLLKTIIDFVIDDNVEIVETTNNISIDDSCETQVTIRHCGREYIGRGGHSDVTRAHIESLFDALNLVNRAKEIEVVKQRSRSVSSSGQVA